MGKDKVDKNPSKRLRENGSQTDEDDEHVGVRGVMSALLEEMNTTLDEVLRASGEIAPLKDEIRKLRDEVNNLKQPLESAEEELQSLQESQKETSAQVKENNEDIEFLFEYTGALRLRNIKLEAYIVQLLSTKIVHFYDKSMKLCQITTNPKTNIFGYGAKPNSTLDTRTAQALNWRT